MGNLNSGRPKKTAAKSVGAAPKFTGKPMPPKTLKGEALAHWRSIVPQLIAAGVVTGADTPALEMLCRTWATWRALQAVVESGEAEASDIHHAFCAARLYDSKAAKFGLTPSDRGRVRVPPAIEKQAKPADGSLEDLIAKQKMIAGRVG